MARRATGTQSEVVIRADTTAFTQLLGRSSQVQPKLRAALRKRVREAALLAVREAQRTVLEDPQEQPKGPRRHTGLRQGIADSIKVSVLTGGVRAGVMVRSTGERLPAGQRALARAYDKPRGWRHPVFGDRQVWAAQVGRPYFRQVLEKHRPQVTAAVEQALQDAIDGLA